MITTIIINWEGHSDIHHISFPFNDNLTGYCNDHKHYVSKYTRCPLFPCQSAMWTDLWKTEIDKISRDK